MEELFNNIASWIFGRRIKQIEYFMRKPHEVQDTVFRKLIESGRDTEWGRKYDYASIQNMDHFKNRVPISSYEELYPYIERNMKGEQNLLWPTEIRWFAKSSGTTNARSKFIPVSRASLEECHFKGGKDLLSLYVSNYPETKIFTGKNLSIGGSYQVSHLNTNMYYGDVSAVIMKNLPFWAEFLRAPDLEIALMDGWEDKIERMAQSTMNENIALISGVPTWTIVLLERILEITGKKTIREVWPQLETFIHGAVAFGPYEDTFNKLIGSNMNYMEVYNASEGFFGMQDQKELKEMLLMLDYGVFYEFIPMEEWGREHPNTVSLEGVELDKNYAMVISTNGGLWRYLIGDTIKFTSKYPYRIKITGRTKHFINAFGEELIIENAESAIIRASEATDARVKNFTAAPVYLQAGKKGGHEWVIEFDRTPENLNDFVDVLDNTLREVNSDYDAKRQQDIALVKPIVHHAPEGTFYNWMKKRGKLGGQNKVPRLSNNREYLDDILELMKISV